ncbi:hypothetical protein E3N88_43989 [Mikania micrantha]|uniref:Uncharacterized protein n=1 Tax=Mikania micrantha TaxID=192012 RepID=A0A5N6LDB1_9ASTR|nr:hypothetical protein E3N88_43989 [Mikania micrantha]
MQATKHIFRYVKGTIELRIRYRRKGSKTLLDFSENSYSVDVDDGNGTTRLHISKVQQKASILTKALLRPENQVPKNDRVVGSNYHEVKGLKK